MLSQILDFGFSIVISLVLGFCNEAVFSQMFPNRIKTATIGLQSSRLDVTSKHLETSFYILNNIEFDDLESIMTTEFAQGLPSDTEFGVM
ncbi:MULTISPECIES: hypothetical protein [Nostoc]|uniref:Uncharacterized protein n=1 Tax=Nostoc linckia FACHB-391 TaxID=2692906 RepID=A0ABR8EX73_NOSLI|nr:MULTISPECIES: hypothetical protein [Nostoc]MBD2562174.1 hypothetical protein [Nostoc linckia FACHB-391]